MEQQIRDFLHAKLPRVASDIEALFRNSIRITTITVADEKALPVGASRIGGTPDLPIDIGWPAWNGIPLGFIAQINLRDTSLLDAANLLPKSGLLSFFYEATDTPWGFDPKDRGSSVVLYFEGVEGNLAQSVPPANLSEDSTFKPCALAFSNDVTIPERGSHYVDILNLTKEEKGMYDELTWMIRDSYNEPVHRLLGYSDNIQGSMELECQLVENGIYAGDQAGYLSPEGQRLANSAGDWILLLQIDTDDNPYMMWGDSGRIYYWIRKQDLTNRDFSKIWLILQCY